MDKVVRPQPAAPEAIGHVALLHDGSLEGLLCAIFEAYARREVPEDIVAESVYQPRLGQSSFFVSSDYDRAMRVRRGIEREAGARAFGAVMRAATVDGQDTGMAVYRFVRYVMDRHSGRDRRRSVLSDLANPVVSDLVALEKRADQEAEKMRQFMRFSHLENGVWFARCNPHAAVVPLVMGYFAARFNVQPFMIYDEVHHVAGIYDGNDWSLVADQVVNLPSRTPDDAYVERLWQRFYDALAIEARYNPELRRHFMPVRFWKNLPEMSPRDRSGLLVQ